MAMACITLFLLVLIATSKAASISSHSCNLNTPPLSASGDDVDMTDLSQVNTSLQYCMIDNCTIMRIDTGEELDIIHTTESLLVAVPTDGHTSEIVLPLENEVSCFSAPTDERNMFVTIILVSFRSTLGLINIYIVAVHLLFQELRSVFGILLMSYNVSELVGVAAIMPLYLMHNAFVVGSQLICQAVFSMFMLAVITSESYVTCILFHIAYIMYRSFKLRSGMPRNLLFFYNCFVFGLSVVFAVIIIGYDLYSGNGKRTILLSGHCLFIGDRSYQTHRILVFYSTGIKVVQMLLLGIFLFFYYKEHRATAATLNDSNVNRTRVSKQLLKIAVAMIAFVGIAQFIWVTTSIVAPHYTYITTVISLLALLLQQCVVMASFMCTRKMSRLCRERFYQRETTSTSNANHVGMN